jgi:hypothetical protein
MTSHCRHMTLSLPKIRIHPKRREEENNTSTHAGCTACPANTYAGCAALPIAANPYPPLRPNSPAPQIFNIACPPACGLHSRFAPIAPDELTKLRVATGVGRVKPIISSIDGPCKVERPATGSDASEIDYIFDFGRFGTLIDGPVAPCPRIMALSFDS